MKNCCMNQNMVKKFPKSIEDFANMFVALQAKRHAADYDPFASFSKSAVGNDIDNARKAMDGFVASPSKDRRAFAAYVLFKDRK